MDEQTEFLRQIVTRLESEEIRYMLTGSIALAIYAAPRMTRDIDLVVELGRQDAQTIASLFASDCYLDVDTIKAAVRERSMFNVIHNEWVIKVDFIVRKDSPYRKLEFERRRRVEIEDLSVWVVAPEDLILSKLSWARESESELQLRDVTQLIESVAALNWSYIHKWGAELGVKDLLDRVRGG